MLLMLVLATAGIDLRRDAPALAPQEARSLSPAKPADALLVPDHPEVVEAIVGPRMMEPPTPPGMPVKTRILLHLAPRRSEVRDFCERIAATIFLKGALPSAAGTVAATPPESLSTATEYRWAGAAGRKGACAAPRRSFFAPPAEAKDHAFAVVRLLAGARDAARSGRRLRFKLSIEDREGAEMTAFERAHPGLRPDPAFRIITDARRALASLRIDAISFVGPAHTAWPDILEPADLKAAAGDPLEGVTVFLGDDWVVGVVLDGMRMERIRLLRQIPPPF